MSELGTTDRHITEMIESHTAPLEHNLKVAVKRIDKLEKETVKLRGELLESVNLLRKYLTGLVK